MLQWNLPWLNHNSQRAYPLSDRCSRQDTSGSITIPDDFIVGLQLPINAGLNINPEQFYLSQLIVDGNGYTISIAYGGDGPLQDELVAAVGIPRALHTAFTTYALAGRNEFADSVGQIVIGRTENIDGLPPGAYQFTLATANLETDAIRPMLRGINSIVVRNGQDVSPPLYGDIELVAWNNMRITVQNPESEQPRILFSAIRGEGLQEECECSDAETLGEPIRFINGIAPLSDGNFRMVGDDCLLLSPITHGLQLTDECSKPCCGCQELEAIERQLDRFADGVTTMQNFASTLSGQVSQTSLVLLGSRLSDAGCVTC